MVRVKGRLFLNLDQINTDPKLNQQKIFSKEISKNENIGENQSNILQKKQNFKIFNLKKSIF